MIFLSYDYRDFQSVKSALRTYQELRNFYIEYKQNGTILKSLLGKQFTSILTMSVNSSQFFQYADQVYSNNPNLLPNNLALLFMLGQNDFYSGKFFGKTTDKLFARIDAKKAIINGYVTYPDWITGVIPNPSVSTTPDEAMVVNLLAKELSVYEKVFNDTLLKDDTKSFKTVVSMVRDFGITLPLSKSSGNDPINKYEYIHNYLNNVPFQTNAQTGELVLFSAIKIEMIKDNFSINDSANDNLIQSTPDNSKVYNIKNLSYYFSPEILISVVGTEFDLPRTKWEYAKTGGTNFKSFNIYESKFVVGIGNAYSYELQMTDGILQKIISLLSAKFNLPVYVYRGRFASETGVTLGIGYYDESIARREDFPLMIIQSLKVPNNNVYAQMFTFNSFIQGKAYSGLYYPDFSSDFVKFYLELNKTLNPAYLKAVKAITPQAISEFIFNEYEIFSSQKEKDIFNVFLSGDISLDYLKNVIIPDKILKIEKDVDAPNFPLFLKKLTTFNPFIFDDNYLLVDVESIRPALLKVSNFIENSLFAQDIHTLNKLADQVSRSIGINNDAIAMLSSEQAKLQKLDEDFQKTLASAKQLQIVYDMLKNQSINAVDPVVQSQMELDKAIKSEMSALEAQYAEKARLLSLQKENELKAQQTALYNAQKAEEVRIAEEKRLQEEAIRKAELEKQNLINQASSEAQTQKELTQWHNGNQATTKDQSKDGKSSTALPLIAVAGVLALVSLGGSNE